MSQGMMKKLRIGVAAASLALAVPVLMLPLSVASYAQTQDVSIDAIDLGPVKIGGIQLTGTNATQEQVQALVTGQMPPADMQSFAKTLTAATISIPSVEFSPPEGGSIAISGIEVEGLDAASGVVGKFTIGSVEVKDVASPNGPVNASIGEVSIVGVEAADLIAALEAGNPGTVFEDPKKFPKFDAISIAASSMIAPMEGVPAPNNLVDVKLGSASLTLSDFEGRVATGAEYAFNNVVMKFPEGSDPSTQLKAIGYDELDLSFAGKGKWDKAAKTYALSDLTFAMANGGKLSLAATMGNVDEAFFTGDAQTAMMAMLGAGVSDATVSFENQGLVEKGLAFAGQQQGKTAEQLQQEAVGMANSMLPMVLGTEPAAQALAKAIADFAASPKNITISAKAKSGMLTAQDFAGIASPADVFSKIDLEATANK